ncbi:MAG: HlyD family secretion protein [Hyphomicrobiaceae bacterium]|nr:HlyD family secretion protein [Hyphomicrobiaceae bacterium]MCC0024743.1 HlyD family secretion protein [Hyphomicrobiaceae bacterium]
MNARVDPKSEEASAESETVESVANAPAAQNAEVAPPARRGSRRLLLMISLPLILLFVGGYFYLTGGRYEDTDDAYVRQAIVSISSDVSGRVVEVLVSDNQTVQKGDVLFHIDAEPYQIALEQAEASLAAARLNVEQLRVSYETAQAKLSAAENVLAVRQKAEDRVISLTDKGVTTEAESDNTHLAFQEAQSNVALARQSLAAAVAALGGNPDTATDDLPSVRAALAALDSAKRNLAKTTIVAPSDGIVSNVENLNVGQFVSAGSTIANLVETGEVWVEANFKETQVGKIIVGQPVSVRVDTYPGLDIAGKVLSIGAATGAEFSLIPAQNASGNWVKVVQRIPVRIGLEGDDLPVLRSGMSVVVTVDTGKSLLDELL